MGYLKFYFLLNQQDNYSLPNPSHHHSLKELHYDENGSYVILTQTFLSTHGGSTLLINAYNNDSREINIIMMSESYGIDIMIMRCSNIKYR